MTRPDLDRLAEHLEMCPCSQNVEWRALLAYVLAYVRAVEGERDDLAEEMKFASEERRIILYDVLEKPHKGNGVESIAWAMTIMSRLKKAEQRVAELESATAPAPTDAAAVKQPACPGCTTCEAGECSYHGPWVDPSPPDLLALADALAEAVLRDWFVWDESSDSKPSGYCQYNCSASMHARMWETTREFVKSQLEDQHGADCLVTKARAYTAARQGEGT